MVVDSSRKVLGRLRCLKDCAEALLESRPLPECVCYVPDEVEYKLKRSTSLTIYTKPSKTGGKKTQLLCTSKHRVFLAGVGPEQNEEGSWVKVKKVFESGTQILLQQGHQWIVFSGNDLVPVTADSEKITCWKDVVDQKYMLKTTDKKGVVPPDGQLVAKLHGIPSGWTVGHDRALAHLMSLELRQWSAGDFVDSVEASENQTEALSILNETSNICWPAYNDVAHLFLNMKQNTVISSLAVCFPEQNTGYCTVPSEIAVYGGEKDSQVLLNTCKLNYSMLVNDSVKVFSGQSQHFPTLKLVFTDSGTGSGMQVKSIHFEGSSNDSEKSDVERGILTKKAIASQPLLASYEPDVISKRSLLLQRIVQLFDSVLMYMMPIWEHSVGSFDSLQVFQHLLPLSKKRLKLINTLLKQTKDDSRFSPPTLYIRRNIVNFVDKLDTEETVFSQIYSGLMKEGVTADESENVTFRFSAEVKQWWRCVFIGEGVIDQGGGFRDTLSDIAEELCPCAADSPLLLPFFIPCPNQQSGVASNYRDAYIPNPSCKEFHKYEWIGKLMGACLRSEENLAITLSTFFWKLLAEERVSWLDYTSVDETQVKTVNEMEKMDKDSFETYCGGMRTWTVILSDGTSVPLRPNGDQLIVLYEERLEYVRLVREARMNETKQQVDAIHKGLLQVVPKAVLRLLTTDELETKICGCAEISFENLKKHVILGDPSLNDSESVQHLWRVLENFTSNDRSQFLRFATGRRRLPVDVYVALDSGKDVLPTASTCGNHFSLPTYTSAKKAEEMIRMAIYSCKFIDADTAIVY